MSDKISPYELEEGSIVYANVRVYDWAKENENHDLHYEPVEITSISGTQKPKHMCDISFKTRENRKYTYHTDNGYVLGSSENTLGTPDRTDIGRMKGFAKELPNYVKANRQK